MTIKVISLASALDRRAHTAQELGKQSIEFEFFDAITPDLIQSELNNLDLQVNLTGLTKGEVACLLSHIVLWHNMIHSNQPHLTVLEDDVYVGSNAAVFLTNYNWIPSNTHIIKIETFLQNIKLSVGETHIDSIRHLRKLQSLHFGTAGYVLTLEGAKSLLNFIKSSTEPLQPIDHIMFEDYLKLGEFSVYQMCPGLVIQDTVLSKDVTLPSGLEVLRLERPPLKGATRIVKTQHPKLPMPVYAKLAREIIRPLKQFFNFIKLNVVRFHFKIVEFK